MNFAERLKELREFSKLTQKNLADLLGLQLRSYQRYEDNTSKPPYQTLIFLADYFNVSLDYLTGRTDNPNISTNITNDKSFSRSKTSFRTQSNAQPILTPHEKLLLSEYRKQPNMKLSIDRLLGIEKKETTALKIARSSTSKVTEITDDFSDLINANPVNSDDDL